LLGVPYPTKPYEFDTAMGDSLNESETYLIKLAHARKNYLSSWSYTPYFYNKLSNWYRHSSAADLLFGPSTSYNELWMIFDYASKY
jgi:hypothetical protein